MHYMDVSKNRGGPPESSILIGVFHYKLSILGGFPLFLETSIYLLLKMMIFQLAMLVFRGFPLFSPSILGPTPIFGSTPTSRKDCCSNR